MEGATDKNGLKNVKCKQGLRIRPTTNSIFHWWTNTDE